MPMDAPGPLPGYIKFSSELEVFKQQLERLQADLDMKRVKLPPVTVKEYIVTATWIGLLRIFKVVEYSGDTMIEVIISGGEEVPIIEGVTYSRATVNKIETCLRSLAAYDGNGQERFNKPDFNKYVIHPVTEVRLPLANVIMNLNDAHHWTREAIAEWLDTLDEQPVFYPKSTPTVQNSARMVTLKPALP
jgi:hypothetical protein